jgi:hypothetical protein
VLNQTGPLLRIGRSFSVPIAGKRGEHALSEVLGLE